MAFHSVSAPVVPGNSFVRSNSRSGAISMLRDELSAAASVIAAEVAAMEGDPEFADLAASRTAQLDRISFLLKSTMSMQTSAGVTRLGLVMDGFIKLRGHLTAMAPFWDYGRTEIDRLDTPGPGPGWFFEFQWLGLRAAVFAGRTPPPLRRISG